MCSHAFSWRFELAWVMMALSVFLLNLVLALLNLSTLVFRSPRGASSNKSLIGVRVMPISRRTFSWLSRTIILAS